jgi:hypothetical protein
MSGYTPVFGSLFQGSLCGQWPALAVFCTLLPLADRNGEIDFSFGYLAAVTGWPEDLLRQGIAQLEQPDPHSRSPLDDGRRLVRIRENTAWGWRLVNHSKYREKARLAAKNSEAVASGKEAQRKHHARTTGECPPVSAGVRRCPPMSDPSDSDSDSDKNIPPLPPLQGGRAPASRREARPSRRCPTDFELTDQLRAISAELPPDFDLDAETAKFRDFEFQKPRKDWPACWRTWMRNARDRNTYARKRIRLRTLEEIEAEEARRAAS